MIIRLFLLVSVFVGSAALADPIQVSVSTEQQSFYLSPKNSSNLFSKYEIKIQGQKEFSERFSLKAHFSGNWVQLSPKQDQKLFVLNAKEVAIRGSVSFFDYSLGGWVINPEGPDVNNIFDVIHSKDYRQPFNSESIGSGGLQLTNHIGPIDLKLFYIPKNQKSLLPDTQSPWWPRTESLPVSNTSGTVIIPDNISYVRRNEYEIGKPFDHNFGATLKTSLNNFDLYGFYFSGANQTPLIWPNFDADVISYTPPIAVIRPPVRIDLYWYRSVHSGAGFSAVLDHFIFKVLCKEQFDYADTVIKSQACSGTVESSFPVSKATVRYFLQLNRQWKQNPTAQELETLLGFFEKSSTLGFLVDVSDESSFSGAIVYNEKRPSVLSSLRYQKKWTDRFKTGLAWNAITAESEPVAKAYDQTDNAVLTLGYDF